MSSTQQTQLILVLATHNQDKVRELRRLLLDLEQEAGLTDRFSTQGAADRPLRWEIVAATDLGAAPEVEEDQSTLEGNARKKAETIAAWSGLPSLADDTGLEVDALGGRPGVFAHRYAGPGATYADNRHRLLQELAGVPLEQRTARFRTVMALAVPGWEGQPGKRLVAVHTMEGVLPGRIALTERGYGGFGYDPIFEIPELGRTLAELSLEEKNRWSHRGRAVRAVWPILQAVGRQWLGEAAARFGGQG